jgi:DNA (cytosine-5)-methyltransferase 1
MRRGPATVGVGSGRSTATKCSPNRAAPHPRPLRLLDLFCGAGGAGMGYHRAGFEVVGVDIVPQPNYPFAFVQADAIDFLWNGEKGEPFDSIHASPPCQAHTTMSNRWRGNGGLADERTDLIPQTREALIATGLPYVIENVPGARAEMKAPYTLNGGMFGLGVDRPRLFETNFPLLVSQRQGVADPVGVYGKHHDGRRLFTRAGGSEQRAAATLEEGREAMGIDWMQWRELAEAIPPAYTEHIGHYLMAEVKARLSEAA